MLCPQILLSANIFEELIEFALWPLAILIFAVVFILGGYVTGWGRSILQKLGHLLPLHYNKRWVDCIIKGILVIVALIAGNAFHLELSQVVDSVIPIGALTALRRNLPPIRTSGPSMWSSIRC